ncbi:carbohydrate ABC transporter permease [Kineosporia sp. A_224]|uniref:carbohydrate ABC transporter permease n=1 Tax=Kineosporia sp. A_224 TaxID=1962180 RepID=UPI000B4AA58A|nr:carbohydrate ABC transporter permease [Kineosporia sp. A_224]
MTTTASTAPARTSAPVRQNKKKTPVSRYFTHVFLAVIAFVWAFPVLWAVVNAFRDYQYTSVNGYVSWGGFTLKNFTDAWEQANFSQHFINSVIITVPAVILTLFLASGVAFVISRFSWRFNIVMLGLFTAANLLPQQSLLIPLYRMAIAVPLPEWMSDSELLYDSYWMLILVNVAFQTGFCAFVLSNYMKTLPRELYEAAMVDGASIWRQYWQLTLPLCRPPLAALATLEVTWIYNEFFWATVLMRTGDKFPVTSALNALKGQFFTDLNLLAAGSIIVAIPTLVIFFALQKQFVAGLTLGANKG